MTLIRTALLARLLAWDARLSQRLRLPEGRSAWRWLAAILAHSGDSWFWFAGLGALWLWGPAAWRGRVGLMLGGIFVTALVVLALKFTIRRRRPQGEWGAIYRQTDPHSFPSGHAARGALLAVLGWGLWPPGIGLALTAWALLVALARVAMGVHYVADVLVGLFIGGAIGLLVLGWGAGLV